MSDAPPPISDTRVAALVQRLLAERSIHRDIAPDDDLREAGLSSLDMVGLVLSVESEFDVVIPESSIMPVNFRSVSAISRLVATLLAKR